MKQKYYLTIAIIVVIILVIYYITQNLEIISEKYCEKDTDCACGVHIKTGNCFYGNKNYVNTEQQCPDFCTGIAYNLMIKCVNNECKQVPRPR